MVYKYGIYQKPTQEIPPQAIKRLSDTMAQSTDGVLAMATDPDVTGALFSVENSGKKDPDVLLFSGSKEVQILTRVAQATGHTALAESLDTLQQRTQETPTDKAPEALSLAGALATEAFMLAGNTQGIDRVIDSVEGVTILPEPDPSSAYDPFASEQQILLRSLAASGQGPVLYGAARDIAA